MCIYREKSCKCLQALYVNQKMYKEVFLKAVSWLPCRESTVEGESGA